MHFFLARPVLRPPPSRPRRRRLRAAGLRALGGCILLGLAAPLAAQHAHTASPSRAVHFSHPIVTEAVAPDTEVGMQVVHELPAGAAAGGAYVDLSLAYALHRSIGVELSVPVHSPDAAALRHPHAGLHLASFALEEHGVVIGYGVEFDLPTGAASEHDHAHAADEQEPPARSFLALGYKRGGLETIASAKIAVPGLGGAPLSDPRLAAYSLSTLYHLGERAQGVLEIYGGAFAEHGFGGDASVRLAPGLRIQPLHSRPLEVGAGISAPLTDVSWTRIRTQLFLSVHH